MKSLIYIIIAVALSGCRMADQTNDLLVDGDDTSLKLSLLQPKTGESWNTATKSTGMTTVQEKAIARLDVLVFNSGGQLVSRAQLVNPSIASPINLMTKSGSGMSIYAIANATAAASGQSPPYDMLGTVFTLTDLQNLKIYNLNSDIATNNTLVMYGSVTGVTININPAINNISIPLNYAAAKVTINLVSSLPAGQSFELIDWSVKSVANFSYMLPRSGDAVSTAAHYSNTSAVGSTWENNSSILVDGVTRTGKSTVFYTYENRRGVIANTNVSQKTGLAPANSTAIVFRGYYRTGTSVSLVVSTVMLGANSLNDYNVARGNQYMYTINVKGLNNISVDTRYTNGGGGMTVDLLNTTFDAHYDWRPLRLGSWQGTASIAIQDGSGNPAPAGFWLKVSAKDIISFVNSGGTYVRPTYTPATDMVYSISNIQFTSPSLTYATYYLYADEFLTVGGTRSAKVVVTGTQTSLGTPQTITINVAQKGVQTMGVVGMRVINSNNSITSSTYTLAVENQEEVAMNITPANGANESTLNMQWGYPVTALTVGQNAYTLRSGIGNTLAEVQNGSNLRAPYGRTGSTAITENIHNSIYNTYAARYCFEKNRDKNGNGTIAGSEINWYLPSNDELLLIYVGFPSLSQLPGEIILYTPYWSSSEVNSTTAIGVDFSKGALNLPTAKGSTLQVRCVRAM